MSDCRSEPIIIQNDMPPTNGGVTGAHRWCSSIVNASEMVPLTASLRFGSSHTDQ